MKKIKIMLISLGVLAVMGGALAFKLSKFCCAFCSIQAQFTEGTPNNTYYCPNDAGWVGSKSCMDLLNATTRVIPDVPFSTNICTTNKLPGLPCSLHICTTLTTMYRDN